MSKEEIERTRKLLAQLGMSSVTIEYEGDCFSVNGKSAKPLATAIDEAMLSSGFNGMEGCVALATYLGHQLATQDLSCGNAPYVETALTAMQQGYNRTMAVARHLGEG